MVTRQHACSDRRCVRRAALSFRWQLWVITVGLLLVTAGCVTTKERGDRAFEAESYQEALDHYEVAMERGSDDPKLYTQAGDAAVRVGDFALAERYYSRALRHGGDADVALKLAEFYISTSNYAKAVRVLEGLIGKTDDEQPVYNNLGTALMYAGMPLEAESYLVVAQQMEPDDPVPYVNLGVLYDKHLNQPRRSIGLYDCFMKMSDSAESHREIQTRLQILRQRYANEDLSRYEVECGKAYSGPKSSASKEELTERLEELKESAGQEEGAADSKKKAPGDAKDRRGESDGDDSGDQHDAERSDEDGGLNLEPRFSDDVEPRELEADKDEPADEDEAQADKSEPADEDEAQSDQEDSPRERRARPDQEDEAREDDQARLERAKEAFEEEDYEAVVDELQQVSVSRLDAEAMSLYGRALAEEGEDDRARRWLVDAVEQDPTPESVEALVALYDRQGDGERILELCEELREEGAPEETLERCPTREMLRQMQQ